MIEIWHDSHMIYRMSRPNLYDYLKILALFTMIVDHVWFLLVPDLEILRVIGRIAFSLFLFLVWYNHSYRFRPSLWKRWIILQIAMWIASYAWYIDMRYANILLAIWATRIILWFVKQQNSAYLEILLLAWAVVFAQSSLQRVDFGTLSIVFGLLWYRVRKRWWSWYSIWSILTLMTIYVLFVQQQFEFAQRNFILRSVLWLWLTLSMWRMSRGNTSLVSRWDHTNRIILWISRHCLELYILQAVGIWLIYALFR